MNYILLLWASWETGGKSSKHRRKPKSNFAHMTLNSGIDPGSSKYSGRSHTAMSPMHASLWYVWLVFSFCLDMAAEEYNAFFYTLVSTVIIGRMHSLIPVKIKEKALKLQITVDTKAQSPGIEPWNNYDVTCTLLSDMCCSQLTYLIYLEHQEDHF